MTDSRGNPEVDAISEKDLGRYFDEHKEDDSMWKPKGRRIRGRRGPSTMFQMRLSPEELEEITAAAAGNVSDFVRTAALEKARARVAWNELLNTKVQVDRELTKAFFSSITILMRYYSESGKPYGDNLGGMQRWIDEEVLVGRDS